MKGESRDRFIAVVEIASDTLPPIISPAYLAWPYATPDQFSAMRPILIACCFVVLLAVIIANDFFIDDFQIGIPDIRLAILVKLGSVAIARIDVEPR